MVSGNSALLELESVLEEELLFNCDCMFFNRAEEWGILYFYLCSASCSLQLNVLVVHGRDCVMAAYKLGCRCNSASVISSTDPAD